MSFTKTTVITSTKDAYDVILELRTARPDRRSITPTESAEIITNGNQLTVKRNWSTESLANNWLQFVRTLAEEAGVTLISSEVVDYVPA